MHTNQEGALLLIALVLLGVIVLSTVYLSLVLLSEIKSTRYTDNGIVSHYVAESAIENALWKLKLAKENGDPSQFIALSALPTGQCAAEDDNSGSCDDPERTYDYTKVAISTPDYTAYNVPKNSAITADIYDPLIEGSVGLTNIVGVNVDWYLESCSGSDRLESTYTPVNISDIAVEPTRTQVDVCTCSGQPTVYGYTCEQETVSGLSTSKFYRFTFRSLDKNVKKFVMSASTAATDIPSQVEIQATGTYRESQKKITARTLWRAALSGIFGFVVFSEESLIKNAKSLTGQAYGPRCGFCAFSTPSKSATCSTDVDCQQCISGKCLNDAACLSNADCVNPLLFTCGIVNNTSDPVDAATTVPFCALDGAPESDVSPINQTDAGSCNALCNGYTFCGDGTIQSPNGYGDGANSGNEECDAGSANSNTVPLACRIDCQTPYCGDGVIDFGDFNNNGVTVTRQETCDDGNRTSHTGNNVNEDECSTACILTVCGDNIINNNPNNSLGVVEVCDEGGQNGSGSGHCKSDCSGT